MILSTSIILLVINMGLDKFKKYPKQARCYKCDTGASYTNPMIPCFECRKKFCFNHIYSGQINKTMKSNDRVRDICKACKSKYNYKNL